jgi:predicted ribosome quality control (RQC) complex YloA/Tae2 family protein
LLTTAISSNTQDKLEALATSVKDDSSKIQHLHGQVEHLRRGVAIESLTPAARDQLQSLFNMSEHPCDLIVQHRILKSLAFEGMYGRYDTVDNAHFKTLRWIFNDSLDDDQAEEKDEPRDEPEDKQEDERDAEKEDEKVNEKVDEQEDERDAEKKADREEDEAKASARELLLNWISSGARIFHISGKLGSGKSTLMKYLCDHDRTKSLLKEWAGKFLRFRQ